MSAVRHLATGPTRPGCPCRIAAVLGLALALGGGLVACAHETDVTSMGSMGTRSPSASSTQAAPRTARGSTLAAGVSLDSRTLVHELLEGAPVEAVRTQSDLPQQSSRVVIFDEATIGVLAAAAPAQPTSTEDYDQIWIDGRHFVRFRPPPGMGLPGGFQEDPPLVAPMPGLFPDLVELEKGFTLSAHPRCAPGEYGSDLPDRAVVCAAVDAAGRLQRVTGVYPNPSTPDVTTTITFTSSDAPPLRAPTEFTPASGSLPPILGGTPPG